MFLAKDIIFCFALLIAQCNSRCTAPLKDFKNILVLDQNNNIQYLSDGKGNLVTENNDFVTLACPGSTIKGLTVEKQQYTCKNNTYNPKITGVTCKASLKSIENKKKGDKICNGNYDKLQISFQYKNTNDLIPQIELCWDNTKKRALWTYATIQEQIKEREEKKDNWQAGTFFSNALGKKYTQAEQDKTLKQMFGTIPPILGNHYLSRGHLTAKSDFVYDAQKQITFHYINAAPQWEYFNGGHWSQLEEKIREFATNKKSDLEVYSGTNGILKINGKEFYLDYTNKLLPVPEYFWKVIVKDDLGVAIIGSNDIFKTKCDPKPICQDILNEINWFNLTTAADPKRGCMIACNVTEFAGIQSFQKDLPNFSGITGLLDDL